MAQFSEGGELNEVSQSGLQRFVARTLYVYFAKPILFLVPAVLITLFGVYSATTAPDEYRSIGSLNISADTFLNEISEVRSSDFSYETPATVVAQQFNEYMQTDNFATEVVTGAGLAGELTTGQLKLDEVRSTVYAAAAGDSLMHVVAVAKVPQRAEVLAESAIRTYKDYVLAGEIDQYNSAETVYNDQVETYKAEVDTAFDAYSDYLIAHPPPEDVRDPRDVAEETEIGRLNAQLTRAQDRLDAAIDTREQARLASVTSSADIDQRLAVIDEPGLPTAPESGLKAMLSKVVLFGVLGLLVSIGAVALTSVLDRSVHSAADLEPLGVPVLAVVPRDRHMRVEPRRLAPVPNERMAPIRTAG